MTRGFLHLVNNMTDFVQLHDGIIVSPEDVDLRVQKLDGQRYARTTVNKKTQHLHRVIMRRILQIELPKHLYVDHINENRLDNRRENLQLIYCGDNTTKTARTRSRSGYMRVYRSNSLNWNVQITIDKAQGHFGTYQDVNEAAFWADVWAYRILPASTLLNFPERLDEIREAALKLDSNYPWKRAI